MSASERVCLQQTPELLVLIFLKKGKRFPRCCMIFTSCFFCILLKLARPPAAEWGVSVASVENEPPEWPPLSVPLPLKMRVEEEAWTSLCP